MSCTTVDLTFDTLFQFVGQTLTNITVDTDPWDNLVAQNEYPAFSAARACFHFDGGAQFSLAVSPGYPLITKGTTKEARTGQ